MPQGASHITGSLWVGGAPTGSTRADMLVLCAKEYQPRSKEFPHVGLVVHAPFGDSYEPTKEELRTAWEAAHVVRRALNRNAKVLVTCAAGLNRSALVASLALMLPGKGKTPNCLSASRAIALMRSRRDPNALMNKRFEGILRASNFCELPLTM